MSAIRIDGEQYHHLFRVLRAGRGDRVEIVDSLSGGMLLAVIDEVSAAEAHLRVERIEPQRSASAITLIVGAPRAGAADAVVESAVELGVQHLCFFAAERSQGRRHAERLERWKRIAEAAVKQSGAAALPRLEIHASLCSALAALHQEQSAPEMRLLFTAPRPGEISVEPCVRTGERAESAALSPPTAGLEQAGAETTRWLQILSNSADSYLVIGPEGGLTPGEIETAKSFGYHSVSLGARTLRVETAALLACGIVALSTPWILGER